MTVEYEWDVEMLTIGDGVPDKSDNEVIDHYHCETFKEAVAWVARNTPEPGTRYAIVLVRDDFDMRTWAYLEDDGTLPTHFMCAYGLDRTKVPKRFHDQVAKG
jgi:hypothetical protein